MLANTFNCCGDHSSTVALLSFSHLDDLGICLGSQPQFQVNRWFSPMYIPQNSNTDTFVCAPISMTWRKRCKTAYLETKGLRYVKLVHTFVKVYSISLLLKTSIHLPAGSFKTLIKEQGYYTGCFTISSDISLPVSSTIFIRSPAAALLSVCPFLHRQKAEGIPFFFQCGVTMVGFCLYDMIKWPCIYIRPFQSTYRSMSVREM